MQGPIGNDKRPQRERNPALYDLTELSQNVVPLVESATGVPWYEEGNSIDEAVAALCRLRRAAAGAHGSAEGGDAAVREALERAEPGSVLWVACRAISYMDEQGFPDGVSPTAP